MVAVFILIVAVVEVFTPYPVMLLDILTRRTKVSPHPRADQGHLGHPVRASSLVLSSRYPSFFCCNAGGQFCMAHKGVPQNTRRSNPVRCSLLLAKLTVSVILCKREGGHLCMAHKGVPHPRAYQILWLTGLHCYRLSSRYP